MSLLFPLEEVVVLVEKQELELKHQAEAEAEVDQFQFAACLLQFWEQRKLLLLGLAGLVVPP